MPYLTGSKQYEAVLGTHETYQNLNARWSYLLKSYLGGEIYRQGQYLTRYNNESEQDYITRLMTTPLDNHCKSVLGIYNAFMFRREPIRDFGSLESDPDLEAFLEDCDLEGRSFHSFMKDVSTYAGVFGHVWMILTKPNVGAITRADEIISGARPYINLLTPLTVLDWTWERGPAGNYELVMFKYMEDSDRSHISVIKEWHKDKIITTEVNKEDREISSSYEETNGLGFIPAVIAYAQRSPKRGIGISEIDDVADLQKFIYANYSEVEQAIRISTHPSLVKTATTEAVAGAGSIVQIDENLDPGLKPYLLQPAGTPISTIYESINNTVESIDRLSNLGSARAKQSSQRSGIAMEVEFQSLNARLSEKADNLELAEENIWRFWALYQGKVWDGRIEYPDSFNIQDKKVELTNLIDSRKTVTNAEYLKMLDWEIMETALGVEDLENYLADPMMYAEPLAVDNAMNEIQQENLGLTNEQAIVYMEQITVEEQSANATVDATTTTANAAPTASASTSAASCPVATQDVAINLKNRQKAINTANYGPLNPAQPNRTFWMAKATMWNVTPVEAKTSRCSNCAAFNQTTAIEDCINTGLAAGGSGTADAWSTIQAGNLGYCEMWDFKCASSRTCDAWVAGGPITDANANQSNQIGK